MPRKGDPVVAHAGAIIQARVGSTRLPRKVLEPIEGRSMLEWVVARLRRSGGLGKIVVAVPDLAESEPLVEEVRRLGAELWRGPEQDVLARYCGAAEHFAIDPIVRVTSDCPLIDPALVDAVLEAYGRSGSEGIDLVANTLPRRWPRGLDVEVVSAAALRRASRVETEPQVREHVTLAIYRREDLFRTAGLEGGEDLSQYRWTVDTPEDLEFVLAVYRALGSRALRCGFEDILELLAARPEISAINADVKQKELPA